MADTADWSNEEHVTIVCELFAEQVRCGNRSSTHLNMVGYKNVIEKFKERTGFTYSRMQFKNKWSKLKGEYTCWKTLLKQTGLGWHPKKMTIDMPETWWKKARKDIPGCGKFKDKNLQNEEYLTIMFEDLRNTGDDHYCAASGVIPVDSPIIDVEDVGQEASGDDASSDEEEAEEEELTPPTKGKGKRISVGEHHKRKKPKTSGGYWMQDHFSKMIMGE